MNENKSLWVELVITGVAMTFNFLSVFDCKDCEGIIEDVILLGSPISGTATDWHNFDRVVSGRIVNGYCK